MFTQRRRWSNIVQILQKMFCIIYWVGAERPVDHGGRAVHDSDSDTYWHTGHPGHRSFALICWPGAGGLVAGSMYVLVSRGPVCSVCPSPENTKHLYDIWTMLDQRRRRWADIIQLLNKCFVFCVWLMWKQNLTHRSVSPSKWPQ